MQRLDRERHRGGARVLERRRDAVANVVARGEEIFRQGFAFQRSRQAAADQASSMARRLSSSARSRPAASSAGNMPPRQYPESSSECRRTSSAVRPSPIACT